MRTVPVVEMASSLRRYHLPQIFALSLILVVAWPLISCLQEVIVAVAGLSLRGLLELGAGEWLFEGMGIDKVYASVFIQMAGQINVQGIGVAGTIGAILHQFLPSLFTAPDAVSEGAWVSAVIQTGSPLLARAIIKVVAAGVLIFLGVGLSYRVVLSLIERRLSGLLHLSVRSAGLLLVGLILQMRGIGAVTTMPLTMLDLEAMGLSQFATKVMHSTQADYESFVIAIGPIISSIASFWLLLTIYTLSFLCIKLLNFVVEKVTEGAASLARSERCVESHAALCDGNAKSLRQLALAGLYTTLIGLVLFASTIGIAGAKTNYDYPASASGVESLGIPGEETFRTKSAATLFGADGKPSLVTIAGTNYHYDYIVNGKPQRIRGVGYNAQYQHLSPEERAAAYARDFRAMRRASINTILGWDQHSFDYYTLAVAEENGIGVVLPYHLPPEANYSDSAVREKLKEDVLNWVARFKDSPSLRIWGIGNEVLHGMRSKEQRKAFADFYRDLADSVHQVDPNHPIMYRDAEDVFIPTIGKALVRESSERPWLVYGMNIFTYRLKDVLAKWRQLGVDAPLIVSEFAPTGLPPRDRPAGYLKMWGMLREHSSLVMGGFMYVWTTAGPEPLDRVYGLVDENGVPTDGSLEAMSAQFLSEAQGTN